MINKHFHVLSIIDKYLLKYFILWFCLISISSFAGIKSKNIDNDTVLSYNQAYDIMHLTFSEDSLFAPEQLEEDFLFFYTKILEIHPNPYHVISKDSLDKKVENIAKSLDKPMNRREFWLKIAILNNYFDSHTMIFEIPEIYKYYSENLKFTLPEDIVRADISGNLYFNPEYFEKSLAGKYIKSINNIPAEQIVEEISAYYSRENKNLSPIYFGYRFYKFYVNLFGSTDSLRFEYKKNDNEIDVRTFYKKSLTNKEAFQSEQQTEWKAIRLKLYEKESIAIIEINTSDIDDLGENYRKDLEISMSSIIGKNIKNLFIDISRNGGGSSDNALEIFNFIATEKKKYYVASAEIKISSGYRALMRQFGEKYSLWQKIFNKTYKQIFLSPIGSIIKRDFYWEKNNSAIQYKQNLYLIQSNSSYSAAVNLSSLVKAYKLATIIGEETGGLTGCYINCVCLAMPNTSIPFMCSVQKAINVGGAMDGRGVLPDIEYKIENPEKSFTLEQLKEMLQLVEEYNKNQ